MVGKIGRLAMDMAVLHERAKLAAAAEARCAALERQNAALAEQSDELVTTVRALRRKLKATMGKLETSHE